MKEYDGFEFSVQEDNKNLTPKKVFVYAEGSRYFQVNKEQQQIREIFTAKKEKDWENYCIFENKIFFSTESFLLEEGTVIPRH